MNDPAYVEAARVLAARVVEQEDTDVERLRYAFRLVTSRLPEQEDLQDLQELLDLNLTRYSKDPKAATDLLQVGDFQVESTIDPARLAAWTTVTSVLFNLDETITRQ